MAQSTRTFRVFVSSTFSDLKAERHTVQEKGFPRVKINPFVIQMD